MSPTDKDLEIWLENTGGGPIYIDKIEFIPVNPIEEVPPPVPPGIYQIVTALNNSSVVDMDPSTKNVYLWQNGNANNQKWRVVYDSRTDAYQFKNLLNENLVLTWNAPGQSYNVVAATNQQLNTQYWKVQDAGNGYVYLRNQHPSYRVLDVDHSNTANGTNIQAYAYNGSNAQKFRLVKLS
ncbi:hypothetical protein FOA24_34340 [Bacillus thuringiensis]